MDAAAADAGVCYTGDNERDGRGTMAACLVGLVHAGGHGGVGEKVIRAERGLVRAFGSFV